MKKLLTLALAAALALPAATAIEFEAPMPQREHRAIWMSPFLSATWPMGEITQNNAEARKRLIRRNFAELRSHGINAVYYHVRANCDATYASSYEPYASTVAGSRGGTPAIDPFAEVVAAGHEYGIEVYAWVNPYRYSSGGTYGAGELNYENSHPEWLIRQPSQIVLNPGIPEVQDRIEAIITEIATNYDIDGMIFDDYFYTSSTPLSADAATFKAYQDAGGEITDQKEWRRENVNETVRRAHDAVKKARPYAVFSIGPAGRISPPNVGDYGLEPGPYGDMNYDALHADCLHWLNEGWLDFLSPQVYWLEYFDALMPWYAKALDRFGRHNYTSVDCSRLRNADVYLENIDKMRRTMRPDENGVVFFDYGAYMGYYETYDGERLKWGAILERTAFPTSTLQPLHPWRGTYAPAYVSGLTVSADRLSWTEPQGAENHRYAVYRIPADKLDAFAGQREYLLGVSYTPSFTLEADGAAVDGDVYAVSVYSRYGYEYAPVFTAERQGLAKPEKLAPAGAAEDLFEFAWQAPAGRCIVEVATDEAFTDIVAMKETAAGRIASTDVANLESGRIYYWRVRSLRGAPETVSDPVAITPARVAITSPTAGQAGVDFAQPTVTWSAARQGTAYTLTIASDEKMANVAYTGETDGTQLTVPRRTLRSGTTYFARVEGTLGGARTVSPTVRFTTVDRSDYEAPAFATPAADGATLHANECISVAPYEGLASVQVQVSNSTSFPLRSGTATLPLNDFATDTRLLSDIKLSGKALVDGQTYYTRVRGSYMLTTSSGAKYTDYSPVRSFVYSATAGVAAPADEAEAARVEGDVLYQAAGCTAAVYDVAGRRILVSSAPEVSLAALPAGCYIISITGPNLTTLKIVR